MSRQIHWSPQKCRPRAECIGRGWSISVSRSLGGAPCLPRCEIHILTDKRIDYQISGEFRADNWLVSVNGRGPGALSLRTSLAPFGSSREAQQALASATGVVEKLSVWNGPCTALHQENCPPIMEVQRPNWVKTPELIVIVINLPPLCIFTP